MIIDSQDLIEKIIKELRSINGEVILAKTMHNIDDEERNNPKSLDEFMKMVLKDAESTNQFLKKMHYNEGRFDAYVKMLNILGFDYKREEDETE